MFEKGTGWMGWGLYIFSLFGDSCLAFLFNVLLFETPSPCETAQHVLTRP